MNKYKEPTQDIFNDLIENFSMGEIDAIQKKGEKLVLEYPHSSKLLNILAAVETQRKNTDKAMEYYQRAITINPRYAEAHNNLGNLYKKLGNFEKAKSSYEIALKIKPELYEATYNLGTIFHDMDQYNLAINKYLETLKIQADHLDTLINLGDIFRQQGKYDDAYSVLTKAEEINHSSAETKNNLGLYFRDQKQLDKAINYYNDAIALKKDYAEAYNNLGVVFRDKGNFVEAVSNYQKAIEINPRLTQAHANLSKAKTYELSDPQIDLMHKMYSEKGLNPKEKCLLAFALGKAYEDLNDHKKAFNFIVEGNTTKKEFVKYDINTDKRIFSKIKANFNSLKSIDYKLKFDSEITPIFIVGMPRSGTTIVEQIISNHSKVYGAGELPACSKGALPIIMNEARISSEALDTFRTSYLDQLRVISDGKPFVTDKMPSNFRYIGIIKIALPEAKIVHIVRDASAVCWSNYKGNFTAQNLGFSNDLEDIKKYYNLYSDLMNFWNEQFNDSIYHLNYELLTAQQEMETRKLIKHLDLSWEKSLLTPETNKRPVNTASSKQVRQKVYKDSSKNWRKYAPYLNGILDDMQK